MKVEALDETAVSGPLYRCFEKREYAEALAGGSVWITTLSECRRIEPPRGDPNEALINYESGAVDSNDPDFKLVASRLKISAKDGVFPSRCRIINCSKKTSIGDAYLLCMTKKYQSAFEGIGKYWVKISNPVEFSRFLTAHLSRHIELRGAWLGTVLYNGVTHIGAAPPPGPIGFVKNPDGYVDQKEVRLLWTVPDNQQPLVPFLLACPDLSRYCNLF